MQQPHEYAMNLLVQRHQKLTASTIKQIEKLLHESQRDIKIRLAEQPSDYNQWQGSQVRNQIENILNTFRQQSNAIASASLNKSWNVGSNMVDLPLYAEGAGQMVAGIGAIDVDQLARLDEMLTTKVKGVSEQMIDKMNTQIGLILTGGKPINDVIKNLEQSLKVPRYRIDTIVHTELGRTLSTATQQRIFRAQQQIPQMGKQWLHSGKAHFRPNHKAIDRQVVGANESFVLGGVKLRYPRDPAAPPEETIRCGCIMIPYMKRWETIRQERPMIQREIRDLEKQLFQS